MVVDADTEPFPFDSLIRTARRKGDVRVLAIGAPRPDTELCRWLSIGVHGFVRFELVEDELPAAIAALSAGRLWFSKQVLEAYALSPVAQEGKGGALTAREVQVGALLRRGMATKEIAASLGIAERTVRFHLQNIFAKLFVTNRHSAARVLAEPGAWAKACGSGAQGALAVATGGWRAV